MANTQQALENFSYNFFNNTVHLLFQDHAGGRQDSLNQPTAVFSLIY